MRIFGTGKNRLKGDKVKYIYTSDCCPKCVSLKEKYKSEGIPFEERNSERIRTPIDAVDLEALVNASMCNMELPVEVDL